MSNVPSVSVVIPCYNAEKWIAECIESCLNQTASGVELIVVDDGSTDNSRQVLQQYGDRINLICQTNSGGCTARNTGYQRSKGEFIQFLDADDYLLPEKLERQRNCLIATGADVVYGDWRHQHHPPDQAAWLEEPAVSGTQEDVLYSLLQDWWVSPAALLFRRGVVDVVNGWDQSLPAAQDRDFFLRVAMRTKRIVYQPGCHSIYRRYGNVTVSTSNSERYFQSHLTVVKKAESQLTAEGRLTDKYQRAIASSYFHIARNIFPTNPSLAQCLVQRCKSLDSSFLPKQSYLYDLIFNLTGFASAERSAQLKKWVTHRIRWKKS